MHADGYVPQAPDTEAGTFWRHEGENEVRLLTIVLTALATTVLLPLLNLILKRIRIFWENRLQYILEGLQWHLGRHIDRRWASRASLAQYTRAQLNSVDFRYLHVPGTDTPLETDDVFIPLALEVGTGSGQTYTADTLLEAGKRVNVVGDPGSGKSTLAKVLLRQACRSLNDSPAKEPLPVLLALKDLTSDALYAGEDPADGLLKRLRDEVGTVHGYEMARLFDSYLDTVGILVLLDGLDEVSTSNYKHVANALRGFSSRLERRSPNSAIVLTMRTHFYHQVRDDLKDVLPVSLFIQAFSPSDIYDFLKKWPSADDMATHIGRIYAQLTDSPGLRDLCTNPLILAMYVANYQNTHAANLPDTRTNFYRKIMDELLVARRSRQLMVQARESLLGQREAILGKLAFENLIDVTQSTNSILWERALEVVSEVTQRAELPLAEKSLKEIMRDTGIISEERPRETLRFNHLTFCEFLAARECTEGREDGWPDLLKEHRALQDAGLSQSLSRLSEVIPFTSALMKRVRRAQALDDVAELGDRVLFMRCLLETQNYDHPLCGPVVTKEADYLCSFAEKEWGEEWLGRVQLLSRLLRDAGLNEAAGLSARHLSAEEFFNRLVDGKHSRLLRLFSRYASHDAAAALRLADHLGVDLVRDFPNLIVKNCDNPAFRAMAVDRANAPGSSVAAWSTALAEAGLRFKAVAMSLHELKRSGAISAAADRVGRRHAWFVHKFPFKRQRSLYTDCITVACAPHEQKGYPKQKGYLEETAAKDLGFVELLRGQRPTGKLFHPTLFYCPAAILIMLILLVAGAYLVLTGYKAPSTPPSTSTRSDWSWTGFIMSLVQVSGATFLFSSYVGYPIYRGVVYQRLLNVFEIPTDMHKESEWMFRLMSVSWLQRAALRRPYQLMRLFERVRGLGSAGPESVSS
jgi:energy-coupling factor transporter ATP-binding protein EcfA2